MSTRILERHKSCSTNLRNKSENSSANCRSSIISTSGRDLATFLKKFASLSNSLKRSNSV